MELEYNKELDFPESPVSLDGLSNLNRIVLHRDGFVLCRSLPAARNTGHRLDREHAILTLKDAATEYPQWFSRTGRKPVEVKEHLVSIKLTENQISFCLDKGNGRIAPYVRSLIDREMQNDKIEQR